MPANWTETEDAYLLELWMEGAEASRIARELTLELGRDISRNAVLGRIHRLRERASKTVPIASDLRRQVRKAECRAKPERHIRKRSHIAKLTVVRAREPITSKYGPRLATPPPAEAGTVRAVDLTRRQCQWICSPDDTDILDRMACGSATDGGPWCAHHRARVYPPGQVNPFAPKRTSKPVEARYGYVAT